MRYIPPFEVLKRLIEISTSKGYLVATAPYEDFIRTVKLLLSGVDVDENWYVRQYPDVAEAIAEGAIRSARQHYIDNGYFEGRLPFPITVDETWYTAQYPDVADSIRKGGESGQAHFMQEGYREGRLPFKQS